MKRLRKFLGLTEKERLLLIKAWILLGVIRLGLWLLPFQTLRRLLARITAVISEENLTPQPLYLQGKGEVLGLGSDSATNKVSWAVETVSRYMPGVKCLARAFATQVLLSWENQPSRLCIGVAKGESGHLEAHAWVESQGKIAIGNLADLSRYTLLPPL